MKKQFCISEQPFGGDSQRDKKMVWRHCSRIQEDGDSSFLLLIRSEGVWRPGEELGTDKGGLLREP